jgi:lysozyme
MTRTPVNHFPDLSHFEPMVDFHTVAAAGIPLVITKCSEGVGYTDPTYQAYAERIRSVGLILGAYVFEDAAAAPPQIAHFLSTAHLQKGDLQPVVDAEALGLTRQETFDALYDLEARGYEPILYCNIAFWAGLGSPVRWRLWLAAYRDDLPDLPGCIRLFAWQHTDHARCPGVGKPCDMSYLYVTPDELQALRIK